MPVAFNLTRPEVVYRRDIFDAGLRAAGYEVKHAAPQSINRGDLLLIWNRYNYHDIACRFEKAGGTVVVAENAYIWAGGVSPHHLKDRPAYALASRYHNDSTVIPEGSADRWDSLRIDLKPWRATGGHVLVLPNRPFGTPGRIMPMDWPQDVCRRLRAVTKRDVRLRPHPGNNAPQKPLADDLAGAWACVAWSSSAAVHALVAGIPTFIDAPFHVVKQAGATGSLDEPVMPDRLPALRRLAWGQFHISEIESGYAFDCLLRPAGQEKVS